MSSVLTNLFNDIVIRPIRRNIALSLPALQSLAHSTLIDPNLTPIAYEVPSLGVRGMLWGRLAHLLISREMTFGCESSLLKIYSQYTSNSEPCQTSQSTQS